MGAAMSLEEDAAHLPPAQWALLLTSEAKLDVFDLKKYIRSDEGLLRLLPVVEASRTAQLNDCNLTQRCCEFLASALSSNSSSLTELDLSCNKLQDHGVILLSTGLESPHCKLGTLRLKSCNLAGGCCEFLASALRFNTSSLTELDLSCNKLQDHGVILLSTGLESPHCKLQTLRLNECNLTGGCCEFLASALRFNTSSLTELDLSGNKLQDHGVILLSTGLESPHCKLETLRLPDCSITKEGCVSLALALRSNPSHLSELDLSRNKPGHAGMEQLSAILEDPHCKLETLTFK